ncbi:MAG: alkaline phosphatase D family protein [Acidimicrobiales bacterium]
MTASKGPQIDRRSFLAGVVATALAAACSGDDGDGGDEAGDDGPEGVTGSGTAADLPPLPDDLPRALFALGVASGDPLPDSVILWTRLVADPLADGGGMPEAPVPVTWQVATDEGFDDVVGEGGVAADPVLAHSVHVDASGLEAGTAYWYRFTVGDQTSPVGRTRTTPGAGADIERVRFAFASCQDRQEGHWSAHQHLADEDVDLVFFLGDYIYEDDPDPDAVRPNQTSEPLDLGGYRLRHGEYRSDPRLQAAHARFPWVCTPDDHEVDNNYAGLAEESVEDGGSGSDPETFRQRRAAAYQAYYEHLPLRIDVPRDGAAQIYRDVAWGSLARFYVLDTRQYRSDQPCDRRSDIGAACDEVDDPARTMLGSDQEAWLGETLGASDATWNVLAQQVVMTKLALIPGTDDLFNLDQWDGYPASRQRVVDLLREVPNPVVITGDIHLSGLGVVSADADDPATEPVATELVGTSISSSFPAAFVDAIATIAGASPAVHYVEARRRGYVVVELTPGELRADYRYVSTTAEPDAEVSTGASWRVRAGNPVPEQA